MKKIYYDEIEDDEVSDFFDEENLDDDELNMFDDPEEIEAEDEDIFNSDDEDLPPRLTDTKMIQIHKNLLGALRTELDFMECDRGVLLFRSDGVNYEGVPMLEINPNKFVFKVTSDAGDKDVMKSFLLSSIRLK